MICLAAMLALGTKASAVPIALTIGDSHELGRVIPGIPASDSDRVAYVNQLISMSLGATTSFGGNTYDRSSHAFSPLDAAVWLSNAGQNDTTLTIPSGGAEYILAKYDGPNSLIGSEVWYIGGLSGTITIPADDGTYGLSGTTFLTDSPGGGTTVPDGGATLALMGAAMVGLGALRRKISKS